MKTIQQAYRDQDINSLSQKRDQWDEKLHTWLSLSAHAQDETDRKQRIMVANYAQKKWDEINGLIDIVKDRFNKLSNH